LEYSCVLAAGSLVEYGTRRPSLPGEKNGHWPRAQRASYWPDGREKLSLSARLGKYFRFNSSLKRGIFLLRRGARDFSLHFATQTQQKPLWGRSALGMDHSGAKARL
jgi:hypothetical protein